MRRLILGLVLAALLVAVAGTAQAATVNLSSGVTLNAETWSGMSVTLADTSDTHACQMWSANLTGDKVPKLAQAVHGYLETPFNGDASRGYVGIGTSGTYKHAAAQFALVVPTRLGVKQAAKGVAVFVGLQFVGD